MRSGLLALALAAGCSSPPPASPEPETSAPAAPSPPPEAATDAHGDATAQASHDAAALYARYCALCHGADREGYAADNAPSLRSPELMGAVPMGTLWQAIAFGRPGTPMAAFADTQGGPLGHDAQHALMDWLVAQVEVERVELEDTPVRGDVALGASVYGERCAECHGERGEGVNAPALGNPVALATSSDAFLRYTIAEGRSGTPMPAFKETLSEAELDGVTAFLRSRAVGWEAQEATLAPLPPLSEAVINPEGPPADFSPREGRFVSADAVAAALEQGARLALLDARPTSDWQRGHLPGALPVPFYDGVEAIAPHLPKDDTWIVAYCACPHAASGKVVDALQAQGYTRAVILDEGVLEWAARGLPMAVGQ